MKNTGLIEVPRKKTDYIFRVGNGVINVILVSDKNWTPYLSQKELQFGLYFDSMACVSFSAIKVIQMIFNYKLAKGFFTDEDVMWLAKNGYIVDGKVNFSDRFTAKMSGTTHQGNWLTNVGDSIRNDGLVPESLWPFLRNQHTPVFDWDAYYCPIPQNIIDLGKEFKVRFKMNYEWVDDKIDEAIKYSPLQTTLYAWPKPIDGIYHRTDKPKNHAEAVVASNGVYTTEDTYDDDNDPAVLVTAKKLSKDYNLGSVMKYTVTHQLKINHEDMVTLYKAKTNSTVYQLGLDGMYHPIANEDFVKHLYGGWDKVKVEVLDVINPTKVGTMIGEYSWFQRLFK